MRVTRLDAKNVHGYLPISIEFYQDLTFLTGLNGSGKTSALRLLMGLLAPSLDDLIDIFFSSAVAVVFNEGKEVELKATKSSDGLNLSISTESEPLSLSVTDLQLLVETRHRDEHRTPLHERISSHAVFSAIRKLSTPMFLGLDRRLHLDDWDPDSSLRLRKKEVEYRRHYALGSEWPVRRTADAIIADVNDLVIGALSEIRAAQERLDEDLRNQILLDSFRYEPSGRARNLPTRAALNSFKERQAAIEKAAAGLKLPIGKLQSSLSEFFERMNKIIDAIEEEQSKPKQVTKPKGKKRQSPPQAPEFFIEWVMNSAQAHRIFNQIELLDQFVADRAKLHQPIDRFLELTNGFLEQTRKRVKVSPRGSLRVEVLGTQEDRPPFALSSGERQLVVMLAHLSLNKRLAESGVFIVDEPELSLHIGWQERFVDAIHKANPNVQLILATHSPAIILDRIDNCRSLS